MRHEGVGVAVKASSGTSYHEEVDCTDRVHDLKQPNEECAQASRSRGFQLDLPTSNTLSESKLKSHRESNKRETVSEVRDLSLRAADHHRNVQNSKDYDSNIAHVTDEIPPEETEVVRDYFPLLSNDIGRNILSRICLTNMRSASFVSEMWNRFILGPELYRHRRSINVREDWIFMLGNNMENIWKVYRPLSDDWLILPSCPNDYMFNSCDKESMIAGFNLLVLGQSLDGYKIWKFDIVRSEWSAAPKMHHDRCLFGSANSGLLAYFGGGTYNGSALKFAERFNAELGRWELLPDMHRERKSCSGFIMDGKFYVIGGQSNDAVLLDTGECYDPKTREWTVIEGMWPRAFVPSASAAPPLVAVLDDELYAINIQQNKLITYVKDLKEWEDLGEIPERGENVSGWGLGFKAVGDELFVIGGSRDFSDWLPYIHAYRPTSRRTGSWRFVVNIQAPTSGFIFNCAVMSG